MTHINKYKYVYIHIAATTTTTTTTTIPYSNEPPLLHIHSHYISCAAHTNIRIKIWFKRISTTWSVRRTWVRKHNVRFPLRDTNSNQPRPWRRVNFITQPVKNVSNRTTIFITVFTNVSYSGHFHNHFPVVPYTVYLEFSDKLQECVSHQKKSYQYISPNTYFSRYSS